MANLSFRLILQTDDASGKLRSVGAEADTVKSKIEDAKVFKVSADQALATLRDVKIALDGVLQVVKSAATALNGLMDANQKQKDAMTLATLAFGNAAQEMSHFASQVQSVTNFGDERMLPLMAKLATTYKLGAADVRAMSVSVMDFAEANRATGMTVETAFDLMGRALNGHTEMLGRYGIELDKNRLATEGVSYLVQKLTDDYGGTAEALVNLRAQNANTWGDIREEIGGMVEELITPLLHGVRLLMRAYQSLNPVVKGFVTGLLVAIPIVGTATTVIIALTAAVKALHIAINPVVGLIGLAVSALAGIGFAFAAAKLQNEQFEDQTHETSKSVDDLVSKHRAIAMSIDYVEAKRRLNEIKQEVLNYQKTIAFAQKGPVLVSPDYFEKGKALEAEAKALRERIAQEDAAARIKYNQDKLVIERKSALDGIALLEYSLAEARKHYTALGAVTAENVDEQLDALERIRSLEKQLAKERETEAAKLASDQDKALKDKRDFAQQMHEYNKQVADFEYDRLRELADVREQFNDRALELGARSYDLQLLAVERYYDLHMDKLLAAGLTEEQITEQTEMAKAAIREQYQSRAVSGQSRMFGDLMKMAEAFGKKGFAVWKTLAVAQAMVDTYSSANAAYKAMAGIPIIGPGLAIAAAAAAIGAGLANVYTISQQEPPKMADGGILNGPSHSNGGIIIEAEGGEYVVNRSSTKKYLPLLEQMNSDTNLSDTDKGMLHVIGDNENLRDLLLWKSIGGIGVMLGFIKSLREKANSFKMGGLVGGLQRFNNGGYVGGFDIPIPAMSGLDYGTGGMVSGSRSIYDVFDSMNEKLAALVQKQVSFDIHVDPLSNDPVRVSEITDEGKLIRSEL